MNEKNRLEFPYENTCLLQIKNKKKVESLACELAESVIEVFQALNFRNKEDFTIPLVLAFKNPNIQSYVLSNYSFPVEHICIDEARFVAKVYIQPASQMNATFIQGYSSYSYAILAPIGFIEQYKIQERTTTINIIPTKLLEEFKATSFVVYRHNITIRIDEHNKRLDKLLDESKTVTWAYITAWNPYSRGYTAPENNRRHQQLIEMTTRYVVFEGEGKGRDPIWKPEKSLLILGISRSEAVKLQGYFQQNAIVFGEYGKPAELIF